MAFMLLACCCGLYKTRSMAMVDVEDHVDHAMIVTSFGVYTYRIFGITGGLLSRTFGKIEISSIVTCVIELVQVKTGDKLNNS